METKSYTFDEIKKKLVNYCVYQDRCHQEVEQKMKEYLLIPEARDEILLYLIKENYLNEERFVRSYIRGKFYIKHWGRNKIKMQLKFRDISEKLINKCFDEIDEKDYHTIAVKIANHYYNNQKAQNVLYKKSKTIKYLLSRGFEYDIVLQALDEVGV